MYFTATLSKLIWFIIIIKSQIIVDFLLFFNFQLSFIIYSNQTNIAHISKQMASELFGY